MSDDSNVLSDQVGPLPIWEWAVIGAGLFILFKWGLPLLGGLFGGGSSTTLQPATTANPTGGGGSGQSTQIQAGLSAISKQMQNFESTLVKQIGAENTQVRSGFSTLTKQISQENTQSQGVLSTLEKQITQENSQSQGVLSGLAKAIQSLGQDIKQSQTTTHKSHKTHKSHNVITSAPAYASPTTTLGEAERYYGTTQGVQNQSQTEEAAAAAAYRMGITENQTAPPGTVQQFYGGYDYAIRQGQSGETLAQLAQSVYGNTSLENAIATLRKFNPNLPSDPNASVSGEYVAIPSSPNASVLPTVARSM